MDLASRGPSRRRFWSLVGPSPTTSRTSLELWPKFAAPVEAPLIKATRGRLKLNPAVPMVMLRSLGARSGEPREVPLAYFTDGDDVILIASNYGGTGHPAWYHKLRAHPECELHIGPRGGRFVARGRLEMTGSGFIGSPQSVLLTSSPYTRSAAATARSRSCGWPRRRTRGRSGAVAALQNRVS